MLAFTSSATHLLTPGSTMCDGTGTQAVGEGSESEIGAHSNVFRPAFANFSPQCQGAVQPTYLGTGETTAVEGLLDRAIDYGAANVPLTITQKVQIENDLRHFRNRRSSVHQIPLYIDSLVIGFNVSCIPSSSRLNLSSQNLSLIFSGLIKSWGDHNLVRDNPSLQGCRESISLVLRSGFAGSTAIFKDFLSKRNPQWSYYKQPDQNLEWPPDATNVGCSSEIESGMDDCVNRTGGSIGYMQYRTAISNGVRMAAIDNPVSAASLDPMTRFKVPSPASCAEAATGVVVTPGSDEVVVPGINGASAQAPQPTESDWSTVSLTDAPLGYPICNFGYVFVFGRWNSAYGAQNSTGTIRTIVDYLWAATDPAVQAKLTPNGYTPLPESIRQAARKGIDAIRVFRPLN